MSSQEVSTEKVAQKVEVTVKQDDTGLKAILKETLAALYGVTYIIPLLACVETLYAGAKFSGFLDALFFALAAVCPAGGSMDMSAFGIVCWTSVHFISRPEHVVGLINVIAVLAAVYTGSKVLFASYRISCLLYSVAFRPLAKVVFAVLYALWFHFNPSQPPLLQLGGLAGVLFEAAMPNSKIVHLDGTLKKCFIAVVENSAGEVLVHGTRINNCLLLPKHMLECAGTGPLFLTNFDRNRRVSLDPTWRVQRLRKDIDAIILEVPDGVWSMLAVSVCTIGVTKIDVPVHLMWHKDNKAVTMGRVLGQCRQDYFTHDATTYPGCSGTPILSGNNVVIGMHIGYDITAQRNIGLMMTSVLNVLVYRTGTLQLRVDESPLDVDVSVVPEGKAQDNELKSSSKHPRDIEDDRDAEYEEAGKRRQGFINTQDFKSGLGGEYLGDEGTTRRRMAELAEDRRLTFGSLQSMAASGANWADLEEAEGPYDLEGNGLKGRKLRVESSKPLKKPTHGRTGSSIALPPLAVSVDNPQPVQSFTSPSGGSESPSSLPKAESLSKPSITKEAREELKQRARDGDLPSRVEFTILRVNELVEANQKFAAATKDIHKKQNVRNEELAKSVRELTKTVNRMSSLLDKAQASQAPKKGKQANPQPTTSEAPSSSTS